MQALYVALGGAIGALARWAVQLVAVRQVGVAVYGTLAVNVLGCFVIGALTPLLARLPAAVPPLVIVGFLGGLTTMSGYSYEAWAFATEGRWGVAAAYAVGSVALSLAACGAGLWIGHRLA
jgi:CrcB protein